MIRARFRCETVLRDASGNETIQFSAVVGGDNSEWSKHSTTGVLSLVINEAAAQGQFVPGTSYYLDFTPVG